MISFAIEIGLTGAGFGSRIPPDPIIRSMCRADWALNPDVIVDNGVAYLGELLFSMATLSASGATVQPPAVIVQARASHIAAWDMLIKVSHASVHSMRIEAANACAYGDLKAHRVAHLSLHGDMPKPKASHRANYGDAPTAKAAHRSEYALRPLLAVSFAAGYGDASIVAARHRCAYGDVAAVAASHRTNYGNSSTAVASFAAPYVLRASIAIRHRAEYGNATPNRLAHSAAYGDVAMIAVAHAAFYGEVVTISSHLRASYGDATKAVASCAAPYALRARIAVALRASYGDATPIRTIHRTAYGELPRASVTHRAIYGSISQTATRFRAGYGDAAKVSAAHQSTYAIRGRVSASLHATYGDTTPNRITHAASYGDKARFRIAHRAAYAIRTPIACTHAARYGDAARIAATHRAAYGSLSAIARQHAAAYALTQQAAARHAAAWAINTTDPAKARHVATYSLLSVAAVQSISHTPEITHAGRAIRIIEATLSADEGSPFWIASIHIAARADYAAIAIGDRIALDLRGELFSLIVDGKTLSRGGAAVETATITAVSPLALLELPFAAEIAYAPSMAMSARLAVEELLGQPVAWALPDWIVPASRLAFANATPLKAARAIAGAVGGLIESAPDGSVICRKRHPVSVPDYRAVSADHALFDSDILASKAQIAPSRGFNRIIVGNEKGARSASDAVEFIRAEGDPHAGIVRAYPQPMRSALLVHTGDPLTLIGNGAQSMRQETELIEFIEGQATVKYQVASIVAARWQHASLGTVRADGKALTADIPGYSLLDITYTTASLDFPVSLAKDAAVQFVLIDP